METKIYNSINPNKWIQLYADYLFNYAFTRLHHYQVTEDLVQDTFVSALKSMKNFRGKSTERTWLVSILKNKIIDYYRKKSNQNEFNLKENDGDDSFFESHGSNRGSWKEQAKPNFWPTDYKTPVEEEEFYTILNRCLSKLPPTWAAVFSLKNMEDHTSKEICKELEISSSNYWVIIHRSKLQLRECMEENWFNDK